MTAGAFVETITEAASVTPSEARRIFYAFSTLHELEDEHLISELVKQLSDEGAPGMTGNHLSSRFSAALHSSRIAAFAKSLSLLTRNERNYHTAKAVTDLRPVFPRDLKGGPVAFAIVHTLQITYSVGAGDEEADFFVAMDEPDLDNLLAVLQRSKDKVEAIKAQFASTQMPYLTTNRE